MGQLVEEVKIWNTPIIGAYLLWQFSLGYINAHPKGEAPISLLHFVANGILTNEKLIGAISNSRPNLQSYVRGFEESRETDLMLGIHERIKAKLKYTLDSIDIAVSHGLLVWDIESARIYPRQITSNPQYGNALKPSHKRNGAKAEILGKWFSEHDLSALTSYLKVVL